MFRHVGRTLEVGDHRGAHDLCGPVAIRGYFLQADCGPESAWLSVAIFFDRGYFWAVAIFSWHLSTYRKRIKKYLRGYFLLVCVAIFRGYPWQ